MNENNENRGSSNEVNNQQYYNYQSNPWGNNQPNNNSVWGNNSSVSNVQPQQAYSQTPSVSNVQPQQAYSQTPSVSNVQPQQAYPQTNVSNAQPQQAYPQTPSVSNVQPQQVYQQTSVRSVQSQPTYPQTNVGGVQPQPTYPQTNGVQPQDTNLNNTNVLNKPLVEYPNVLNSSKNNKNPKKSKKKIFIIILLLILIALIVLFLIINNNNNNSESSNPNNSANNNSDNGNNIEEPVNIEQNENNIDSIEKINSKALIDEIERYARFSSKNISGYEVQVPVATVGDVICTTNDGSVWSGVVATGSETCDNFMKSVINKVAVNPQEAKIIFDATGIVKKGSWIKLNDKYCTYNGTSMDNNCTDTKVE